MAASSSVPPGARQSTPAWLLAPSAGSVEPDRGRVNGATRSLESDAEVAPALESPLAGLTTPQRTCILLRERDGRSVEEIAMLLQVGRDEVRDWLFEARERLCLEQAPPWSARS